MKSLAALVTACLFPAAVVHAAPPERADGRYTSAEQDHGIELFVRDSVLSGRIAWTKDPNLTDKQNTDPKLRRRTVAGIHHIRDFRKARNGDWTGGTLYNPEDGKTYEATLWLEGDKRLIIQGRPKVPVLGGLLGALFGRIAYTRQQTP